MIISSVGHGANLKFYFKTSSFGPHLYLCNTGVVPCEIYDEGCYEDTQSPDLGESGPIEIPEIGLPLPIPSPSPKPPQRSSKNKKLGKVILFSRLWTPEGSGSEFGSDIIDLDLEQPEVNDDQYSEWLCEIENLKYNIEAKHYNQEYFLDFCYRGPEEDFFHVDKSNEFLRDFHVNLQATSSMAIDSFYSSTADLYVRGKILCDMQGVGKYPYAHDNYFRYGVFDAHTIVGDQGGDLEILSEWQQFTSGNLVSLLNQSLNEKHAYPPRFCKIRISLQERSGLKRQQEEENKIIFYADIEEYMRKRK